MEEILHKYLNNELTPEEWKKLKVWLDESQANRNQFNKFLAYNTNAFDHAKDVEEAVLVKLGERLENEKQTTGRKSRQLFLSYYWRVAAVFLAIAIFSFILYQTLEESSKEISMPAMVEKTVPAGRKITTKLPDGTLVWLNSESKIRFYDVFPDSSRDVYLEGEAYFEVIKASKPFRVHTSHMSVTALGTAFSVAAFGNEPTERVALVEGKIGVKGFDHFYEEILPGNALEMNEKTQEIRKVKLETDEMVAWKDGVLLLQNLSYSEVFRKLERWYGVQIKVDGKIPSHNQFFGRFENASLEDILKSISSGKIFDFDIKDKNVLITFLQH